MDEVGVAQLVERWIVIPEVAGSSPVTHPNQTILVVKNPCESRGFFMFALICFATHLTQARHVHGALG